jgi:hypothetical protein
MLGTSNVAGNAPGSFLFRTGRRATVRVGCPILILAPPPAVLACHNVARPCNFRLAGAGHPARLAQAFSKDSALAPGKPAGLQQARTISHRSLFIGASIVLVALAFVLPASSTSGTATAASTTN